MVIGAALLLGVVWVPPAPAGRAECLVAALVGTPEVPEDAPVGRVRCRDGDACDADGSANGVCTFPLRLCVNQSPCDPAGIERLRLRGPLAGTVEPALVGIALPTAAHRCTASVPVEIELGGRSRRARTLRVRAQGAAGRDRDRVRLVCERAGGRTPRALVVTTDFQTGILARLRTDRPHRPRRLDVPIHADALVRVRGEQVFVINRFLGDSIQILDPDRGFRPRLQCSTGAGSNPHDIALVDAHKAYVTRYDRRGLWVVDPQAGGCGGFHLGTVDLGSLADGDGLPEMSQLAVVGGRAFVTVQRLDRARGFAPTGTSQLAVLDATTDTLVAAVPLIGQNAFGDASGIVRDPATGHLLLGQAGDVFRTGDGGIEAVDPVALVSRGFVVTEDALGGSVTDFVLVGPRRGYAVVLDRSLRSALVAFDPATGTAGARPFTTTSLLPDVALAPDGRVWLATRAGVRVLDPTDERLGRAIDLGLAPFSIGFVP